MSAFLSRLNVAISTGIICKFNLLNQTLKNMKYLFIDLVYGNLYYHFLQAGYHYKTKRRHTGTEERQC